MPISKKIFTSLAEPVVICQHVEYKRKPHISCRTITFAWCSLTIHGTQPTGDRDVYFRHTSTPIDICTIDHHHKSVAHYLSWSHCRHLYIRIGIEQAHQTRKVLLVVAEYNHRTSPGCGPFAAIYAVVVVALQGRAAKSIVHKIYTKINTLALASTKKNALRPLLIKCSESRARISRWNVWLVAAT